MLWRKAYCAVAGKKKISPFGVFMCEKQIWDVQVLEYKKKQTQRQLAYEVYIIKPNVSMVIFLQKSVYMCSVAAHLAAPSFPGPLLHHISSLACSAPSLVLLWGWVRLSLEFVLLGTAVLNRKHRSDKGLLGECREGDNLQLSQGWTEEL